MKMFNLGYGYYIPLNKIKAVLPYESVRIKREVQQLKESEAPGKLFDVTKRKAIKTVIVMDDDTYVLCNVSTETIARRIRGDEKHEQG